MVNCKSSHFFFLFLAEGLLEQFSQTQDSWKHCLYYMANSKNEYVTMYCMTVLEVTGYNCTTHHYQLTLYHTILTFNDPKEGGF